MWYSTSAKRAIMIACARLCSQRSADLLMKWHLANRSFKFVKCLTSKCTPIGLFNSNPPSSVVFHFRDAVLQVSDTMFVLSQLVYPHPLHITHVRIVSIISPALSYRCANYIHMNQDVPVSTLDKFASLRRFLLECPIKGHFNWRDRPSR